MGRWAQARRRGSCDKVAPLAAPVLTADSLANELSWTWTGEDPVQWIIDSSVDGVTEWEPTFTDAGVSRMHESVDSGFFYRIQGVKGDSSPVTEWSNVVHMDL